MKAYPQIERFVRDTLGCSCPDGVFDKIVCRPAESARETHIEIGGRLLVYLIDADGDHGCFDQMEAALRRGVSERNRRGFNRFRLVLGTSRPDDGTRAAAEEAFRNSPHRDERVHLHVVDAAAVSSLFLV
jgi:hypothetical protein